MSTINKILRNFWYLIEFIVVCMVYAMFWVLPMDIASRVGARLMKLIGPHLKAARIAEENVKLCFPNYSEADVGKVLSGMWDNLGRIIGEIAHIHRMSPEEFKKRVRIKGEYSVPGMFVSAHFGNFELPAKISQVLNLKLNLVYRPVNNQFVNILIRKLREIEGRELIKKGLSGIADMLKALKRGESVGMLVDQRMKEGAKLLFFGMSAKTVTAPARVALKQGVPIYLVFITRREGCYFDVEFRKIDGDPDYIKTMQKINDEIEYKIRQNPEQWFWVHRRWRKEEVK